MAVGNEGRDYSRHKTAVEQRPRIDRETTANSGQEYQGHIARHSASQFTLIPSHWINEDSPVVSQRPGCSNSRVSAIGDPVMMNYSP